MEPSGSSLTVYDASNYGPNTLETTPLLSRMDDGGSCDSDNTATPTTFWQEMSILVSYAFPVFGSQLLEFSLVIVEVISVGHISTAALAAVSLGSMTANVAAISMLQGFSSALDTLLPSSYTSCNPRLVGLWSQRMAVVLTFAVLPMFALCFNAESILLALKQEPEIARLAASYLLWFALGLPAIAFNCISRRYFQSQGFFSLQTHIMLLVAPVNVLLNYLLVWGPEPIRLGFIGAPIATSVSFTLVSLVSIFYGVYLVPHTAWHPISSKMFTNLGVLVHLGFSGIGQVATEWWAWELLALAASFLGPVNLAAQSILLTSATTTFQAGFALSNASAIRVGNLLGEKDAKRAAVAAKSSIVLALIVSLIISSVYMILRKSWAHMFNSDPEVVAIVTSVIPIIALFQIVDSNTAVTGALLRARGKQFIGAVLNISAYYLLGLPLGIWLAFHWHLGLSGLWLGVTAALFYCSAIGTSLALSADWKHEVARVETRIAEEERIRKVFDHEEQGRDMTQ